MGIEGEGRVGLAWPDPAELLPLGHSMDFGFFFAGSGWEVLRGWDMFQTFNTPYGQADVPVLNAAPLLLPPLVLLPLLHPHPLPGLLLFRP